MINEGARILEEGIAVRPGDIDAIWLHGYNWPAWRGGPMFYADLVGLARIRDRLLEFHAATGDDDPEARSAAVPPGGRRAGLRRPAQEGRVTRFLLRLAPGEGAA